MKTFTFEVRTGSTAGPIVAQSVPVTINNSVAVTGNYTITPSVNSVDEGKDITFNVSTTGVPDGTTLYYTISGTNVIAADFSDNILNGSVVINSNAATFTKTITLDSVTEGSEAFTVQLRTGSITGTVVATTSTITITEIISSPPTSNFECTAVAKVGGIWNSKEPRGQVTATPQPYSIYFDLIKKTAEGTYGHPSHFFKYNPATKLNDYWDSSKVTWNSGETLYGVDRVAGAWEKASGVPNRQKLSIEYFKLVDQYSGYGDIKAANQQYRIRDWSLVINQKLSATSFKYTVYQPRTDASTPFYKANAWKLYDKRPDSIPELREKKHEIFKNDLDYFFKLYFLNPQKSYASRWKIDKFGGPDFQKPFDDVLNFVKSDGRITFWFIRLYYNGIGYMANMAAKMIREYRENKFNRNPEQLLCSSMTWMYNTYSGLQKSTSMVKYHVNL